jgi:hypothetical protein
MRLMPYYAETQFGPVHGAMLQWPSKEPMKWL